MKKSILIITSCLILTTNLKAQKAIESQKQNLQIGVKSYFGYSDIHPQNAYGNSELDFVYNFAYTYNFELGYKFSKHFGIYSQYGVSNIGSKANDNVTNNNATKTKTERKLDLKYTQIPLLLRYTTKGKTKFYLEGGVIFSSLKSAFQNYTPDENLFDSAKPRISDNGDITNRFLKNDLLLTGGMGAEIYLSKKLHLSIGTKLNYSLEDINSDEKNVNGNYKWRVQNFSGKYNGSHNRFAGIGIGITYSFLSKEKSYETEVDKKVQKTKKEKKVKNKKSKKESNSTEKNNQKSKKTKNKSVKTETNVKQSKENTSLDQVYQSYNKKTADDNKHETNSFNEDATEKEINNSQEAKISVSDQIEKDFKAIDPVEANTQSQPKIEKKTTVKNIEIVPISNTESQLSIKENIFRIQVYASEFDIGVSNSKFNDLEGIHLYQHNGLYKYTTGKYSSHLNAKANVSKIKQLFPDAFIVHFTNGRRFR